MTTAGLCILLDVSQQAWGEYRQREGFGEVTTRVHDIISNHAASQPGRSKRQASTQTRAMHPSLEQIRTF